jgi:hypothetical protein
LGLKTKGPVTNPAWHKLRVTGRRRQNPRPHLVAEPRANFFRWLDFRSRSLFSTCSTVSHIWQRPSSDRHSLHPNMCLSCSTDSVFGVERCAHNTDKEMCGCPPVLRCACSRSSDMKGKITPGLAGAIVFLGVHVTILIYRTPEILLLAVDSDEQFVQIPDVAEAPALVFSSDVAHSRDRTFGTIVGWSRKKRGCRVQREDLQTSRKHIQKR